MNPTITDRSREFAARLNLTEEEVLDYGDGLHVTLEALLEIAERKGLLEVSVMPVLGQNPGHYTYQASVKRADGGAFTAFGHAREEEAKTGNGAVCFAEDLAEKRALAKALRRAYRVYPTEVPEGKPSGTGKVSADQVKRFWTLCSLVAPTRLTRKETLAEGIKSQWGVESANDFTFDQYEQICDYLFGELAKVLDQGGRDHDVAPS